MAKTRIMTLLFCLIILSTSGFAQTKQSSFNELKGHYLGQIPPVNEPVLFAPGIVSSQAGNHSSIAISPDGKELCWLNNVPNQNIQLNPGDKEIDKAISAEMSKFNIPSIVACVIKKDKIVWENAYGYANIEKKVPATTGTIYHIASTSKLVTSVALLQLYEQNILDIDKDINIYLPFFVRNPNYPDKIITPRLLLTHRSGLAWPIYDEDPDFYEIYPNDSAPDLGGWLKNYITPGGKNFKYWRRTAWISC